jgi:hypothetical protein
MKYDNRQTLSENVEKITINEQRNPNTKVETTLPATDPKVWEAVNEGYIDNISAYACKVSKMTFTELASLFKTITPKYGVITPDLIGYGIFNKPSIATVILENEIYLRRIQNKDSFYEIMIPLKKILNLSKLGPQAADTSNNIGSKPVSPESTLLSSAIIIGKGFTSAPSYYAGKSATVICSQGVIPAGKPKPKPKKEVGMDFTNIPNRKTMWEKINQNYKKKNPNVPIDMMDLRINGTNKDKGFSYSELDAKKLYQTNPNWQYPADIGTNIYEFARSAGYSELQSSQILKKFGTPNEIGESNWKKFVIKLSKQEQSKKENEEYEKSLGDKKTEIIDNPIVKKVFPNVNELMKDEDCKVQYLKFFQGVINGMIRNKNNRIVGKPYYNNKGQMFIAKWNESTPPCTNEWWDKYGWMIQVGGAVVASIVLPGYGWGLAAQVLIDGGLNLYSLEQAKKSQDEDRIKMETAYLFLPILMATKPVRVALENLKFTKKTIDELSSELTGFNKLSRSQQDFILLNLSPEKAKVLTEIGTNSKIRDVIKQQTKELMDKVKNVAKGAKLPVLRKYSEPLVNLFVYGAPMVGYVALQINKLNKITKEKIGRNLSKEEEEFIAIGLALLNEKDAQTFTKGFEDMDGKEVEKMLEIIPKEGLVYQKVEKDPNLIEDKEEIEKGSDLVTSALKEFFKEWKKNNPDNVEIKMNKEPNSLIKSEIEKTVDKEETDYAPGS